MKPGQLQLYCNNNNNDNKIIINLFSKLSTATSSSIFKSLIKNMTKTKQDFLCVHFYLIASACNKTMTEPQFFYDHVLKHETYIILIKVIQNTNQHTNSQLLRIKYVPSFRRPTDFHKLSLNNVKTTSCENICRSR